MNLTIFLQRWVLATVTPYSQKKKFNRWFKGINLENIFEKFVWEKKKVIKDMFDNYFFFLFSVFKNNFLFLRLKNLFGNPKETENKNCSQNSSQ